MSLMLGWSPAESETARRKPWKRSSRFGSGNDDDAVVDGAGVDVDADAEEKGKVVEDLDESDRSIAGLGFTVDVKEVGLGWVGRVESVWEGGKRRPAFLNALRATAKRNILLMIRNNELIFLLIK